MVNRLHLYICINKHLTGGLNSKYEGNVLVTYVEYFADGIRAEIEIKRQNCYISKLANHLEF